MVSINDNAQGIINELIENYCDYRLKDEYGISSFWYWLYQIKNHILSLQTYEAPIGENLVYKMPNWGDIIYSKKMGIVYLK